MTTTHNQPTQSKELHILNSLSSRMNLPASVQQRHNNLLKGYIGEWKFYQLLKEKLTTKAIVLYDLLLPSSNTTFQLDSLLIYQDQIVHFEVKNYEGDFYIENDNWYVVTTKREIRNPLIQVQRSNFLLRNILQQMNNRFAISSHVVFINNEFTLYNAPLNLPVILPSQTSRYLNKLNNKSGVITENHEKLAENIIEMQIDESPYERLPQYDYHEIKKGILCKYCNRLMSYNPFDTIFCRRCEVQMDLSTAIMGNVKEFALLFPEKRITTSNIYEWCKIVNSKKTIRRVLMNHLKLIRKGRFSYFTSA